MTWHYFNPRTNIPTYIMEIFLYMVCLFIYVYFRNNCVLVSMSLKRKINSLPLKLELSFQNKINKNKLVSALNIKRYFGGLGSR